MTTKTTALQPVDRSLPVSSDIGVTYNLDAWPEDRFNRLIPTQTIDMPGDLFIPVIVAVQLDVERDTYESRDLPNGHRAPNAVGIAKLASAAGINFFDEERLDDGSDPLRAHVRVKVRMETAFGDRVSEGARDYNLASLPMSDAQRARAKGYVYEHAATRARHRAIRALLSLRQSYPVAEIRKPFAIARVVWNSYNPEVRAAMLANLKPTVQRLYGPDAAKQVGPGAVEHVPPVEDDADNETTTDGQYVQVKTNGHATVDRTTGEVVSESPAEVPGWFGESGPSLIDELHQRAGASSMAGPANELQRPALTALLSPLGGDVVMVVLAAAFGLEDRKGITAGQAQAILGLAGDDADAFRARWAGEAERLVGSVAA